MFCGVWQYAIVLLGDMCRLKDNRRKVLASVEVINAKYPIKIKNSHAAVYISGTVFLEWNFQLSLERN